MLVLQLLKYTLAFFGWMIIGRVVISLITGGRRNLMVDFFIRFTEPFYLITGAIFPFARVSPEKEGTAWARIGGCIPFFALLLIQLLWIVLYTISRLIGIM